MSVLNVTGRVMVFRNVKEDGRVVYRTSVGHKEPDGTFKNVGITVRFPKGSEPTEERTLINIKSSKLDHFEVEDGRVIFYIFVFEHEIIPDGEATSE